VIPRIRLFAISTSFLGILLFITLLLLVSHAAISRTDEYEILIVRDHHVYSPYQFSEEEKPTVFGGYLIEEASHSLENMVKHQIRGRLSGIHGNNNSPQGK
jgi:hypothetical protein